MPKAESSSVQVLIKKRRRIEKVHGGAWKVAYADFVTAMMALFIVLWVLNQDNRVIQAIGGYFKEPTTESKAPESGPPSNQPGTVDPKKLDKQQLEEAQKKQLEEAAKNIMRELQKSPEFAGLTDQIKFEIVPEGLRIEIVESSDDVFFEIGTADLKPNTIRLLAKIGGELKLLPNRIIVEGHTDSRPYAGEGHQTNFELSAERASAARMALNGGGLREKQIEEIRGCADSRLRDPKDPLNVVNRRISILVRNGMDTGSGPSAAR